MVDKSGNSSNSGLPDTDLPYFAYGLLQPHEIAHTQIKSLLRDEPIQEEVQGALYARDGLPLLAPGEGYNSVGGYLLRFAAEHAGEAYRRISAFEPAKHYKWGMAKLLHSGETANVLVGKRVQKGSTRVFDREWRGNRDPLLTSGLSVVEDIVDQYAGEGFESAHPDFFDWERLFRLQMAYMFLWTVMERYAALAYGPSLGAMQKIRRLGEDRAFQQALKRLVRRKDEVYRSSDPEDRADLDPDNGVKSANYYYYVRSNITHRGKAAFNDAEKVRESLLELHKIFGEVLEERMGVKGGETH